MKAYSLDRFSQENRLIFPKFLCIFWREYSGNNKHLISPLNFIDMRCSITEDGFVGLGISDNLDSWL